jgi:CHAD domain-containing protein
MAHVVGNRFKKINAIVRDMSWSSGTEDIHRFRVKVKKLRGFLRLIQRGLKHPDDLKIPKDLKKLYDISGSIRSLQLQRQNIKRIIVEKGYGLPECYLNMLDRWEAARANRARALMTEKKHFKKSELNTVDTLPGELKKKSIKKFLQESVAKLDELQKLDSPSDESLHMVRKLLKDILYTWRYIKKETVLVFSCFPGKENILLATDLLGDFHDICVGINLLDYTGEIKNENEQALLLTIKQQWLKKKKTIQNQVPSKMAQVSFTPL